jgi:hypothetical protein
LGFPRPVKFFSPCLYATHLVLFTKYRVTAGVFPNKNNNGLRTGRGNPSILRIPDEARKTGASRS